ncbi:MAG TPA: biotin transporter BioY [Vicinamibacterales bacterium]
MHSEVWASGSAAAPATLLDVMTIRATSRIAQQAERIAAAALVTVATAIAAQVSIPLPFTPVPFTFQPMIVLLGAMALGSRLGMTSQCLYLALGVAGLPVFAASPILPQGVGRLIGPTGGYLMAYPAAAFVAGWLAERGFDRRYLTAVAAMACGLAMIFASGVTWLAVYVQPGRGPAAALAAGLYPFIAADVLKLLIAAAVMPRIWALTGRR